jgi:hypothetical protein
MERAPRALLFDRPAAQLGRYAATSLNRYQQVLIVRPAVCWIGVLCAVACYPAPVLDTARLSMCVNPTTSNDGRVHLDGSGFGPRAHQGDSVIVEINGRERWRGLLDVCTPEHPFDLQNWQAPGDTVIYESSDRLVRESMRSGPWVVKLMSHRKVRQASMSQPHNVR